MEINSSYRELAPNMLDLIDLLLTIPVGSTDCERGFNRMKLAKTDQRNRLGNASLNDQIMIMLSPSTIGNFDPVEAVSMWNEAWTPMLTMKPTRQTKCKNEVKINENKKNKIKQLVISIP